MIVQIAAKPNQEVTPPRRFLLVVIYLTALNFLSGNMGSFSPELNDFFALGALAAFIIAYFPLRFREVTPEENLTTVFLMGSSVLVFGHGGVCKTIAISIFVFALNHRLQGLHRKAPELFFLLVTTILYSIFLILYQYVPAVWLAFQGISGFISQITHAIIPQGIDYGVTYSGLKITVIIWIFCLVVLILTGKKKIVWCTSVTVSIIFVNIVYISLHSLAMSRIAGLYSTLSARLINFQFIGFFCLLPFVYVCLRVARLNTYSRDLQAKKSCYIVLAALLPILFLQDFFSDLSHQGRDGTVVFHNEGQVDWKLPVFDQYGGKSGGMFGLLIKLLRARGYEVDIKGISQESLEHAGTLVLINSNRMFTEPEKQTIWQFVKRGGSLLVVGEHTGLDFIRNPFNDLLSTVNIRFNFDSAVSMVPKWTYGFELAPHYITRNIRDENDLQIWIGASLSVTYPARPLIVGKYAYSDHGDMQAKNRGYLGNMRYSRGERLGDLILVAENKYGSGKVLVFGDTSPFQNSALFLSSQFVEQVFQWLSMKRKIFYPFSKPLTALAFLSAILCLIARKPRTRFLTVVLTALLALPVLVNALTYFFQADGKTEMKTAVSYIDVSHLERFNFDAWGEPNGFGGLCYNLVRNGYYPLVLRKFDRLKILAAQVLVLIAPAKPFTDDQVGVLEEFVRSGGCLILTLGWEEKDACRSLLKQFDIDVENIPLGRIAPSQNLQGLSFNNAWPVTHGKNDTKVLCSVWNYPVAVLKRHAKGAILFVGDSSFLLNKNLEGLYNYSLSNIMFLKRVFNQNPMASGDTQ